MARLKITHTCQRCGKLFHPWSKGKDASKPRLWCSYACRRPPLLERFWNQVNKTETCWVWAGDTDKDGYGRLWNNEKKGSERTHRLSWEIHNGPIPSDQQVLHQCDNPPCIRPNHLFLGTNTDNNNDAITKGRNPQGEWHGRAKVNTEQVREIRRRYREEGVSQQRLADKYGLKQTTVSQIVRLTVWKSVK